MNTTEPERTAEVLTKLRSGPYPPVSALQLATELGPDCVRHLCALARDKDESEFARFWALMAIHWTGDDSEARGMNAAVRIRQSDLPSLRIAALELLNSLNRTIAKQMATQHIDDDGCVDGAEATYVRDVARRILDDES
jgi:hypothetical protein